MTSSSAPGNQRVDDLLDIHLEVLRELVDGGSPAALVREALLGVAHLQRALLGATGHVHRPARVAEVTAHLTEDGGHRKRGERVAPQGIEAVQCLQQAQRCDLEEIVKWLGGAVITPGQAACQRHEARHQRLARLAVAVLVPAVKQLLLSRTRGGEEPRRGCHG